MSKVGLPLTRNTAGVVRSDINITFKIIALEYQMSQENTHFNLCTTDYNLTDSIVKVFHVC